MERIQVGKKAYLMYSGLMRDTNISRKTKLNIYKAAVHPTVTYAQKQCACRSTMRT